MIHFHMDGWGSIKLLLSVSNHLYIDGWLSLIVFLRVLHRTWPLFTIKLFKEIYTSWNLFAMFCKMDFFWRRWLLMEFICWTDQKNGWSSFLICQEDLPCANFNFTEMYHEKVWAFILFILCGFLNQKHA